MAYQGHDFDDSHVLVMPLFLMTILLSSLDLKSPISSWDIGSV